MFPKISEMKWSTEVDILRDQQERFYTTSNLHVVFKWLIFACIATKAFNTNFTFNCLNYAIINVYSTIKLITAFHETSGTSLNNKLTKMLIRFKLSTWNWDHIENIVQKSIDTIEETFLCQFLLLLLIQIKLVRFHERFDNITLHVQNH